MMMAKRCCVFRGCQGLTLDKEGLWGGSSAEAMVFSNTRVSWVQSGFGLWVFDLN